MPQLKLLYLRQTVSGSIRSLRKIYRKFLKNGRIGLLHFEFNFPRRAFFQKRKTKNLLKTFDMKRKPLIISAIAAFGLTIFLSSGSTGRKGTLPDGQQLKARLFHSKTVYWRSERGKRDSGLTGAESFPGSKEKDKIRNFSSNLSMWSHRNINLFHYVKTFILTGSVWFLKM